MWRPIRSSTVPPHPVYGYSINQVTGARFPDPGQYGEDSFDGYESLFEALDAEAIVDKTEEASTFDFSSNKRKSSSWGSFNRVDHYTRNSNVIDAAFAFFSRESGVKWRNYGSPVQKFWNANLCQLNVDPVLAFGPADFPIMGIPSLWMGTSFGSFKDDQGLFGVACQNMLPGIAPKSSLINSIYELKDLRTVPHTLRRINMALDKLHSIQEIGKILTSGKGKQTLRSILKSLTNAGTDSYLQSNFNVIPLLQDISNVYKCVGVVDRKLKQLAAQARQTQTVHWGRNLSGFNDSQEDLQAHGRPTDEDAEIHLKRSVKYEVARFQATMEYSYEMPPGSYAEHRMQGIRDYLGLTVSLQVLWNAIPWSFVIDWVVGVGPWLSQFTGRQLDIVTHIAKSGWSVRVARNVSVFSNLTGPVGNCREESYYRTPAAPPLVSSLQTSGVNPKEFTLGAALANNFVK